MLGRGYRYRALGVGKMRHVLSRGLGATRARGEGIVWLRRGRGAPHAHHVHGCGCCTAWLQIRSGQDRVGPDPTVYAVQQLELLTSYGDISKVWSTKGFDLNQHLKYFLQFSGSFELGIAIHLFLWTHGDEIYAVVRVDLLM